MNVIRRHDYLRYAPKDAKPNVKALRRIMHSFLAAVAVTCLTCTLVIRHDILAQNNPRRQRAAVHHCACKADVQCLR